VYLACSIRGDRSQVPVARAIDEALTAMGHEVLTGRFLDERAENEDGALTEQDVFTRDVAWMDSADVIVAEASGSTYGVGFEVGYMLARAPQTEQRIIVIDQAERRDRISRLISGLTSPYARAGAYTTTPEAVSFVERARRASFGDRDRGGP
jgi:nucleoside 2-deoxyribosyltransferase